MTIDPRVFADRLGAEHFGQVPDTGGGAFGMARLAEALKQRLDAREARKRGSAVAWVLNSKVKMSAETERLLIALADKLSTPEHRVNPMELAAQLLEESVQKLASEKPL